MAPLLFWYSRVQVSVMVWSLTPFTIMALNCLLYAFRRRVFWGPGPPIRNKILIQQHTYLFIIITFLVLPPVSRKQFQVQHEQVGGLRNRLRLVLTAFY